MLTALMIALQTAAGAPALPVPATPPARLRLFVLDADCPRTSTADTIIVCGQDTNRYRLPLPTERESAIDDPAADRASGTAALRPPGRCGIFAGERRCSKAEARHYGYGAGRDPITLVGKLVTKVADPDSD